MAESARCRYLKAFGESVRNSYDYQAMKMLAKEVKRTKVKYVPYPGKSAAQGQPTTDTKPDGIQNEQPPIVMTSRGLAQVYPPNQPGAPTVPAEGVTPQGQPHVFKMPAPGRINLKNTGKRTPLMPLELIIWNGSGRPTELPGQVQENKKENYPAIQRQQMTDQNLAFLQINRLKTAMMPPQKTAVIQSGHRNMTIAPNGMMAQTQASSATRSPVEVNSLMVQTERTHGTNDVGLPADVGHAHFGMQAPASNVKMTSEGKLTDQKFGGEAFDNYGRTMTTQTAVRPQDVGRFDPMRATQASSTNIPLAQIQAETANLNALSATPATYLPASVLRTQDRRNSTRSYQGRNKNPVLVRAKDARNRNTGQSISRKPPCSLMPGKIPQEYQANAVSLSLGMQLPQHGSVAQLNGMQVPQRSPVMHANGMQVPQHSPGMSANGMQVPQHSPGMSANGMQVPQHSPVMHANGIQLQQRSSVAQLNEMQVPQHSPGMSANGMQVPQRSPGMSANGMQLQQRSSVAQLNGMQVPQHSPGMSANGMQVPQHSPGMHANGMQLQQRGSFAQLNGMQVPQHSPGMHANGMQVPQHSSSIAISPDSQELLAPCNIIDSRSDLSQARKQSHRITPLQQTTVQQTRRQKVVSPMQEIPVPSQLNGNAPRQYIPEVQSGGSHRSTSQIQGLPIQGRIQPTTESINHRQMKEINESMCVVFPSDRNTAHYFPKEPPNRPAQRGLKRQRDTSDLEMAKGNEIWIINDHDNPPPNVTLSTSSPIPASSKETSNQDESPPPTKLKRVENKNADEASRTNTVSPDRCLRTPFGTAAGGVDGKTLFKEIARSLPDDLLEQIRNAKHELSLTTYLDM